MTTEAAPLYDLVTAPRAATRQFAFLRNAAAEFIEPLPFADTDLQVEVGFDWRLFGLGRAFAEFPQSITADSAGTSRSASVEKRLRELQSQFVDDYGSEIKPISTFALRALLRSAPGVRAPSLSADPAGQLIATWWKGGASISLRLLRSTDIHYAFGGEAADPRKFDAPRYGRSTTATFFHDSDEARQLAA